MTNITRVKKGESIVSGKVLVTCTVTILGIGSHSGTGEEWADDDNGMTSADAQAFKRACSCFGLGRYFYDIQAIWVDLDQNRQPVRTPALFAWALPENWRKGMRPLGRNGNGSAAALPTVQMDEAKPTGAAPQGFRATATLSPETAKLERAEVTATTSMHAFCVWKRLSARCCIATSCASTAALTSQS